MIIHPMLGVLLPTVAPFGAVGFVLGAAYFTSMRRSVRSSVARGSWARYMLLTPVRVAAAALFLSFAVRWGVSALLAASAGFLIARQLAVRAARRLA
jgi:hypothetical protein